MSFAPGFTAQLAVASVPAGPTCVIAPPSSISAAGIGPVPAAERRLAIMKSSEPVGGRTSSATVPVRVVTVNVQGVAGATTRH